MEADIAEVLWCWSEEENKLRYMVFVGDGDGSSFGRIAKLKPYGDGPEAAVVKEDCLGHIQKRMGTKLREVKRTYKGRKLADGKGIGGKQRMTNKKINDFQVYYGKAIRSNLGNVEAASNAVMAIFMHSISTDKDPKHHLCPDTPTSWCGYQQSLRLNKAFSHKAPLPEAVAEVIKPVFTALADKALLARCMKGLTQNTNEALHATMWNIAPKHLFNQPQVMFFAAAMATGIFNDGHVFLANVIQRLGYDIGPHTLAAMESADKERIRKARQEEKAQAKEERKKRRKKKHAKEDTAMEKEGVMYEPGGFGPDGHLITIPETETSKRKCASERKCRKCKQPMKGHKRGQACPSVQTD